ncbi:spore coat protein [Paenibacillus qinlingensis]|uniref:Spore coat protein CotF n=1 Tax=Paenibacillus qinlingensis TaxID=1837343 RepID=A0ABU1P1V1_9BACL|nr:spore coat protein [Paenibacillus qinlingensis]MDR6553519.1 spore coat protein CotF [Paenibacillus qinlingensis]
MYQSNSHQQHQGQQVDLEDLDFANFVLSELKRSAREYTTAALEAANPGIRQTFETLLQKTLDDQALVFQEIQSLGGYQIQQAEQQMIEQEIQKQSQTALQVQSIVQQHVSSAASMSQAEQQYQQRQPYSQQQGQANHQNQAEAVHQAPTPTARPAFQPVNYANQYPNAAYSNQQGRGQSQGYTPSQTQHQSSSYNQTHTRSYQDQSHDSSSYGRGSQGYAASSNPMNENPGMTAGTGRPTQARIVSRTQQGMPSSTTEGNSYLNRSQEGNKYNF